MADPENPYEVTVFDADWLIPGTGIAVRLSGGKFKAHLTTIHFSVDDMNAGRMAFNEYFQDTTVSQR